MFSSSTPHAASAFAAFAKHLADQRGVMDEAQIQRIVTGLLASGDAQLRYFNDTRGNMSIMGQAGNSMSGVCEVVKNMTDSVIERLRVEQGAELSGVSSVEETVSLLLPGLDMTSKASRGEHAHYMRLNVDAYGEGSEPDRACVRAIDRGTGMPAADFPATFCARGGSRKERQPWQHGRFNSGFSQALVEGRYTLVSSCCADEVALTVIFRASEGEHAGSYVYLVDPTTNLPFTCSADQLAGVEPGTDITFAGYRLEKRMLRSIDAPAHGFRKRLRGSLVRPVLPMRVGGSVVRKDKIFEGALRVQADAIRTHITKTVAVSHNGIDYGNLKIIVRVFNERKADQIYSPENVKYIYNESTYAVEDLAKYRQRAKLSLLPGQSEVFFDLSDMDEALLFDHFFTTDRTHFKHNDVSSAMRDLAWESLREWDELRSIEQDLVKERIQQSDAQHAFDPDKLLRLVGGRSNVIDLPGKGAPGKAKLGSRTVKPVELRDVPTFAKVHIPVLTVQAGNSRAKMLEARVSCDAPDGSEVYAEAFAVDGSEAKTIRFVQAGAQTRQGRAGINVRAGDGVHPSEAISERVIVRVTITTPTGENCVFDIDKTVEVRDSAYHMRQGHSRNRPRSAGAKYEPLMLNLGADIAPANYEQKRGSELVEIGGERYLGYDPDALYDVIVFNCTSNELKAAGDHYNERPEKIAKESWTRHLAALYKMLVEDIEAEADDNGDETSQQQLSRRVHTFHALLLDYDVPLLIADLAA
jgi:hypothetical protein